MPPRSTPDSSAPDPDTHLTQEETSAIAELLRQGLPTSGEDELDPPLRGPALRGASEPIVLRYDLVAGATHRGDELPGLQLVHERFAAELASTFRRTLGDEGIITAEPVGYGKFVECYARLSTPGVICVAELGGVGCSVVLSLEYELALCFIDLLMGGQGGAPHGGPAGAARGLTSAEKGVLRHLVALISSALHSAWLELAPVELQLLRVATDPRHAAIYEPSEPMAELAVAVTWGEVRGTIRMALPTSFLARFESVLARGGMSSGSARSGALNVEAMSQNLAPAWVGISAILGRAELTLARLLALAPGDVLRLDTDPAEPVAVCVEGTHKMTGYPTVQHGNVAVQVVDFVSDDSPNDGAADGRSLLR